MWTTTPWWRKPLLHTSPLSHLPIICTTDNSLVVKSDTPTPGEDWYNWSYTVLCKALLQKFFPSKSPVNTCRSTLENKPNASWSLMNHLLLLHKKSTWKSKVALRIPARINRGFQRNTNKVQLPAPSSHTAAPMNRNSVMLTHYLTKSSCPSSNFRQAPHSMSHIL